MDHIKPNARPVLNQALLARTPVDSSALVVRGTILHRLADVGSFRVEAFRNQSRVHSELITVVSDGGRDMLEIALGNGDEEAKCCCSSRNAEEVTQVRKDGVLRVHVQRGMGRYTVRVIRVDREKSSIVFDSANGLSRGDAFAVTLVAPGRYALSTNGETMSEIVVAWPDAKKPPARQAPTMIDSHKRYEESIALSFGGTVIVHLKDDGAVVVKAIEVARPFAPRVS
jgi:hypothetical protein